MNIYGQSKFIFCEICKQLSLENIVKLSGVCKKIRSKIYYNVPHKVHSLRMKGRRYYPCLIKENIDDFLNEKRGATELTLACRGENLQKIDILLKAGANINKMNLLGWAALMVASLNNNPKVVKFLLEKGAIPDICVDDDGFTPLRVASLYGGGLGVMKYLIDGGAEIDKQDCHGKTALMHASSRGYEDAVKFLLEKGANTEIRSNKGETALMIVSGLGYTTIYNKKIIEIFEKYE